MSLAEVGGGGVGMLLFRPGSACSQSFQRNKREVKCKGQQKIVCENQSVLFFAIVCNGVVTVKEN